MNRDTLDILRQTTIGTGYENRLFLVGGYVRDKLLGRVETGDDIDIVLVGDAAELADFWWRKRIAAHKPVTFPTFGTAMLHVGNTQVEIVTARAETYRHGSRKPVVVPGTLQTDAERRDFTINTLLENLHSGAITDPTGHALPDLDAKILRTPTDPIVTFSDDPLRMLRACRFAAKLGFSIAPETYDAIIANADKCNEAHGISFERIRDELNKTLLTADAPLGLNLLRETGLMVQFAPELATMYPVTQNRFHAYDVWTHTLYVLGNLPPDTSLELRLAALFHDIGKPATRTVGEDGEVHFYGHADLGAKITVTVMNRLRFSNEEIKQVSELVALHMRYGEYQADIWTDSSVRRLIRAVGEHRNDLFTLTRADALACGVDAPRADLDGLRERMATVETTGSVTTAMSPLSGQQIIELLDLKPGKTVGKIKDALTDAVVAGTLLPGDIESATSLARQLYAQSFAEEKNDRTDH